MATTCSTKPEGVTFRSDEDAAAIRVAAAESALFLWACGNVTARQVRPELKRLGVHLMGRLNPGGPARIDAVVDGYGPITLTF